MRSFIESIDQVGTLENDFFLRKLSIENVECRGRKIKRKLKILIK